MINYNTLLNTALNLGRSNIKQVDDSVMTNSWANNSAWDGTWENAGYWVDAFGFIHFTGLIKSGTVSTSAFTISEDVSPRWDALTLNITSPSSLGRVDIRRDGSVVPLSYASWINLGNLHGCIFSQGFTEVSYQNSWAHYDTSDQFDVPSYIKDPLQWVHLRGLLRSGTSGAVAFTLPSGYRPSRALVIPTISYSGSYTYGNIAIATNGQVTLTGGNTFFTLGGDLTFTIPNTVSDDNWEDIPDDWFNNNWTHYSSSEKAQYQLDAHGMVHLRGNIKRSTGSVVSQELILDSEELNAFSGNVLPVDANGSLGAVQIAGTELKVWSTIVSATKTSLDGLRWRKNLFS